MSYGEIEGRRQWMIVPRPIDNLFVAGRCASMTHDGQSSARVTGPCLVMGQAAGTAADMALASGVAPRAVDVPRLQRRLERAGAFLGVADEPANALAAADASGR